MTSSWTTDNSAAVFTRFLCLLAFLSATAPPFNNAQQQVPQQTQNMIPYQQNYQNFQPGYVTNRNCATMSCPGRCVEMYNNCNYQLGVCVPSGSYCDNTYAGQQQQQAANNPQNPCASVRCLVGVCVPGPVECNGINCRMVAYCQQQITQQQPQQQQQPGFNNNNPTGVYGNNPIYVNPQQGGGGSGVMQQMNQQNIQCGNQFCPAALCMRDPQTGYSFCQQQQQQQLQGGSSGFNPTGGMQQPQMNQQMNQQVNQQQNIQCGTQFCPAFMCVRNQQTGFSFCQQQFQQQQQQPQFQPGRK